MISLPMVDIQATSIASAWCKLISEIYNKGELHMPDYKTSTRRVHATIRITDTCNHQVSQYLPFKEKALGKYKLELTKEYSDYYTSLPDDDKRKFEYCYAKQLFAYGPSEMNTLRENIRNIRISSRRHVGVLWENETHINKAEDQPCWIAYKLEWALHAGIRLFILYRSWDAFGGFPANIPAIVYGINKVLMEEGVHAGISEIIATGWDAHIYDADMQAVESILKDADWCCKCEELKPRTSLMLRDTGKICAECYGGKT